MPACIVIQPFGIITNIIILIIELMVIVSVTNKIFSRETFETKENLYKHTVFKENYKYWLIGNTIPLVIIIFLIFSGKIFDFCEGMDCDIPFILKCLFYCYHRRYIIIFTAFFLTSLTVKLLKKDLPVYFYGSINIFSLILGYTIYHIIDNLFIRCIQIKGDGDTFFASIFFFIFSPIIGGFIVDIYRHFFSIKK